jgi:glycosyltransferase involved in cell wall biosynthesis
MVNTFFSIIVPLFNKEKQVIKTVESALNQSYSYFELLIVDDGSTDNGLSMVMELQKSDDRIKVFTKPNGGVSSARNYAIQRSTGKFIALLDADDYWETSYLKTMNELINRFPECGIYACAYKAVKKNHEIIHCQEIPEGIVDNYFKTILKHRITWTSATVIRKEAFDKVGYFPLGMHGGEDYFLMSKVAIDYKVAFTPKPLSSYNMTNSTAFNRIGKPDSNTENWIDLYKENAFYRNEFIAKKAIENGIRHAWGGFLSISLPIEKQFKYTQLFRNKWLKLYILNRIPKIIMPIIIHYKRISTYYYLNRSKKI